jgi:hypothetical protein
MISALVTYLDANDAGTSFYSFARELGLLSRNTPAQENLDFWSDRSARYTNTIHGVSDRFSPHHMAKAM